ncbi:hypothetical protein GOODEAATRI_013063, partial [Goodea atripinnis]
MSCMRSCPACLKAWCIPVGHAVSPNPAPGGSFCTLSSGQAWRRCWLAYSPPPSPSTLLHAH